MHRFDDNTTSYWARARRAFLRTSSQVLMATALVGSAGCTATSNYMHPATASQAQLVAPPDKALVVFMRPSGLGRAKLFTVINGKGLFLGDAQAGTRFAVAVPPGEQMFITWSETVAPMRANLLPGHVYYVLVDPRMGVWKARVDLLTVSKRTGNWKDLNDWLKETEPYTPDGAAGRAYLATEEKESVHEVLGEVEAALKELDPKELSEKTLMPDDGVPTSPASPTAAPQPGTSPSATVGAEKPST